MNFPSSFSRKPKTKPVRFRASSDDLFFYQAITGRPVGPVPEDLVAGSQRLEEPRRPLSVSDIALRIRTIWHLGLAHSVRNPQVANWFRLVSDKAFKRIDEAQVRMHASCPHANRRRVKSRELLSVQPADEFEPTRVYKRAA